MNYRFTKTACYTGYFVQSIVNNLSPLLFVVFKDEFGISYSLISMLVLINFLTQLAVDALAVKIVPILGEKSSLLCANILSAVGLILLGVLPNIGSFSFFALVVPTVIFAVGSGLIEVLVSPIIDRIPSSRSSAEMSLLHSFYCIGHVGVIIISTLFLSLFGKSMWYLLPIIWAIVPAVNAVMFLKACLPPEILPEERTPIRHLVKTKTFIMFGLLMLSAGAAEQVIAQWSSLFAEETLGVSKSVGDLLGPCLFAALMASGRLLYGFFGHKISVGKTLSVSALLTVGAYLLVTLSPWPILSLIGVGLCGFSVSIMWPGVFSLCSEHFKQGGTPMFALLALAGDLGCAFGPFFAGMMSDLSADRGGFFIADLKFGILCGIVFPILMFAVLRLVKKQAL